jgi:AbrB family looped-hinge helix DNA binding protein
MPIVTVKNKFQIVIPQRVREQIGVAVGDLLEAKVERGKITLTPKSVVDRGIAASLAEFAAGESHGPFSTHDEFLAALRRQTKPSAKSGAHTPRKHAAR